MASDAPPRATARPVAPAGASTQATGPRCASRATGCWTTCSTIWRACATSRSGVRCRRSTGRGFATPPPAGSQSLAAVHDDFMRNVLPYSGGNANPGFMGWVQGAGTPVGMLAEMLAAGLNANLGGRDHAPIQVEREVAGWMRDLFGLPQSAAGLFVTGASMANFIGVIAARTRALGAKVRRRGLASADKRLVAYTSRAAHSCVRRAMEMSGLGAEALRLVDFDARQRIDLAALRAAIAADKAAGLTPFMLVGNAGTVDVGAIDDLDALADIARDEAMWLHIDGAYGALGVLSDEVAPKLAGLQRADSIAFDFHKWGQVPYDAGFLIAATARRWRRVSPPLRPICSARRPVWPAATSGPATTARTYRAASAR